MNTRSRASVLIGLLGWVVAGFASGDPGGEVPVDPNAEAAYQLEAGQWQDDWRLDPAVFTDISPVSIPEVAIKLPEDQEDDG